MKRVGLIAPHTDTTIEADLQRHLHGEHSVHTQRVWLDSVTVEAEETMLQEGVPRAAAYLAPIAPEVLVFGCTSAGALRGVEGETAFRFWLAEVLGCPVVSAFESVRQALVEAAPAGVVWLLSPYTPGVHETMLHSLAAANVAVRDGGSMGIGSDLAVGRLEPAEIVEFVHNQSLPISSGDQVFISCTNLRAAECAETLAHNLGCPVTTSNTAILGRLLPMLNT